MIRKEKIIQKEKNFTEKEIKDLLFNILTNEKNLNFVKLPKNYDKNYYYDFAWSMAEELTTKFYDNDELLD